MSLAKRPSVRPSAAASGIPCTFPVGRVSGVFRSPCASSQSTPPTPRARREPAERPQRDGVVAAEHERQRVLLERERDEPGDAAARGLDLGQVARARSVSSVASEHGSLDVAPVEDVVADRGEPVVEPRVADGRRTHVDAAAARAEVERGADDRDLLACSHDAKPYTG